jgi:6-pyruvoyltetrahydropterin/6-carboxytetrahydropterin synthase
MIFLTLSSNFSAAHFYHQKKWSEQKNREKFGKCFSKFGHGHDYKVEVTAQISKTEDLEGTKSKLAQSLKILREKLDHKHLNLDLPDFHEKIPTTENIALFCLQNIQQDFTQVQISSLRVYETPDLFVEIKI